MGLLSKPSRPLPERMPPPPRPAGPRIGTRLLAAVGGVGLALAGLGGTWRSLVVGASRFGSFRALLLLVPAIFLWRYAATGRMRQSSRRDDR